MSRLRKTNGVHAFELICGLLILVPIVLYGIDYITVLYGGQMSASCTSAACRAAAAGPPDGFDSNNPQNCPSGRASTILKRMVNPTAIIRMKSTVLSVQTIKQAPTAPFGGPFDGTVSIKTRCDVFPPFLLPFVSPQVVIYKIATYPITWVMPSGYAMIKSQTGGGGNGTLFPPIPDNAP